MTNILYGECVLTRALSYNSNILLKSLRILVRIKYFECNKTIL